MAADSATPPALRRADLEDDPFQQFRRWWDHAQSANLSEPTAMTLATAAPDGAPSARIVLLRGFDERGFDFYTNYLSRKGSELTSNARAALVFFWPTFQRQVRVEGRVEKTTPQESDVYFARRPFGHRLGAVASPQSQVIPGRQ